MNHLCLWISWLILPPSIPLCSSRPNLRLLFGILSIFGYHGIYGNRLSLMPWWVKKATLLRNFSQSDCWLHLLRIYFTILVGISKIHQASNLPWCWSVPWWFMNINLCMWRDHVTGKMSWCFAFFFREISCWIGDTSSNGWVFEPVMLVFVGVTLMDVTCKLDQFFWIGRENHWCWEIHVIQSKHPGRVFKMTHVCLWSCRGILDCFLSGWQPFLVFVADVGILA